MTYLPWGIPDEAVSAASNADEASAALSGATIRAMLEAALPHMQFSPLGDNHHAALKCPHCRSGLRAAITAPRLVQEVACRMHPSTPQVEGVFPEELARVARVLALAGEVLER